MLVVRKRGTAIFMKPGGKREPGEDDLTALAREIDEELGCRLIDADPAGPLRGPGGKRGRLHGPVGDLFGYRRGRDRRAGRDRGDWPGSISAAPGDVVLAPLMRVVLQRLTA
jgi:8-oxo-dGTP diphosphatase